MSAKPERNTPKSTPASASLVTAPNTSPARWPAMMSRIARNSSSGTSPSASRTRSAVTAPSPIEITWSVRLRASRIEPSAARAIIASASSATFTPFLLENGRQAPRDVAESDALEIEALKPAENRRGGLGDLLRLRGREDEDDARRRLLEDLEQRVPRFARQHVGFVDDVDLEAVVPRGSVHRSLAQLARVVDPAVRRGVDLDDIEARRSAPDALTRDALAARLAIVALVLAVERHRQHACERGLPHPARPAQQVAVRDSSSGDCPAQRVGYVRLDGNVSEALWAVFAGECERHCEAGVPQA